MRLPRIKNVGEETYYHVFSRTVGQEHLLTDSRKEELVQNIKKHSMLYFVDIIGYCVMSNHFHLLVKMNPNENYTDSEIMERVNAFYGKYAPKHPNIKKLRERLEDISYFMRSVKQTFAVGYNRMHNRKGYFWSERFGSVVFESGESLLSCLSYIDLNPVRAEIVEKPEDYRWCSLNYRVNKGYSDNFLSFAGVFEGVTPEAFTKNLRLYREFVYRSGGIAREGKGKISQELIDWEEKRGFVFSGPELFGKRLSHFTEGLVLGSKEFIRKAYKSFMSGDIFEKKTMTCRSELNDNIHWVRRQRSKPLDSP